MGNLIRHLLMTGSPSAKPSCDALAPWLRFRMFLKSGYDISKDFTGYIEVRLYHFIPHYTF